MNSNSNAESDLAGIAIESVPEVQECFSPAELVRNGQNKIAEIAIELKCYADLIAQGITADNKRYICASRKAIAANGIPFIKKVKAAHDSDAPLAEEVNESFAALANDRVLTSGFSEISGRIHDTLCLLSSEGRLLPSLDDVKDSFYFFKVLSSFYDL